MPNLEIETVSHERSAQRDLLTFGGVAKAYLEKTVDGSDRMVLEGVASSSVKDRMGDTISRAFMQKFERQSLGMTTFLNHDYDVPEDVFGTIEVATLRNATDSDQGECQDLFIRSSVDPSNPRAVKVWEMVKNGRKLGFSIGARVSDAQPLNPDDYWGGMDLQDGELLEVSVVGIPANQRAYIQAKGFRRRAGLPFDPDRRETQKAVQERIALKNEPVPDAEKIVEPEVEKAGARHNAADLENLQKCYGAMQKALEHQSAQSGHLQLCYKGLEALLPGGGDEAAHSDGEVASGEGIDGMGTERSAIDAVKVAAITAEITELLSQKAALETSAAALAAQVAKLLRSKTELEQMVETMRSATMPRLTAPNPRIGVNDARNRSQGVR